MTNVKGTIHRTIGSNLFKFRFSSYAYMIYLKLIRENGVTPEQLTHFETRLYLLRAGLEAAGNPLSVNEVCELIMDEMSDDDQIALLEEAGTLHQPFAALALDLRAVKVYWDSQSEVQRNAIEMMSAIGGDLQDLKVPQEEVIQ